MSVEAMFEQSGPEEAHRRAIGYAGLLGTAEGAISSALIYLSVGRPDWAAQTLQRAQEELEVSK